MNLPRLEMQQTYAQIGINITKPVQKISQPKAELNLEQEPALLEMKTSPPKMTIDSDEYWAELNIKGPLRMTRDAAENAKQEILDIITEKTEEGNQLQGIERGYTAISDMALQKGTPEPADFNVSFFPSFGAIKIDIQPGTLDINWTPKGKKMNPVIHKPECEYEPGKVEVYLKQKNDLKINPVGLNVDLKL